MSEGPDQTGRDQDSEPNSPAGAASPQAEQADDKEQSEGGEDLGEPAPDAGTLRPRGLWTAAPGAGPTAIGLERAQRARPAEANARHEEDDR